MNLEPLCIKSKLPIVAVKPVPEINNANAFPSFSAYAPPRWHSCSEYWCVGFVLVAEVISKEFAGDKGLL